MPDTSGVKEWEKLCRKCGLCCFEKIEDERGNIYYTQTACRFLDIVTRECRIYEKRFEINPGCVKLTPKLVETLIWLPRDCGYHTNNTVKELPGKSKSTKPTSRKR